MSWTPLWRQAHTAGFVGHVLSGKNHTVVWDIPAYAGGTAIRVSFLNHYGNKATKVKAMTVVVDGKVVPVTRKGKKSFQVPAGERVYSDELKVKVPEGTTLSPRFGYFGVPKFDDYMNEQRKKYNEWIRTTDIFDYVFDADELLRDPEKPDWFDDRYHQGDHLHPSTEGGQLMADTYDLAKLTGKQ